MSPLLCPVADLMQTRIVRCPATEGLGAALALMQSARVGSILVDCSDASCGILTRTDLIERVILPRKSLDAPVSEVMSHPVRTLPVESSVLDAMEAMMRWRLRHLPLVSGGAIVGLLSEHDLMRQLRNSPDRLMLSIERAKDEESLIRAAGEAAAVAGQLHRESLPALQIARMMSLLNDALTRQAIHQIMDPHGASPSWAWIALGSEARAEQTIVTDQDNALILADPAPGQTPDPGSATSPWILAEQVNILLDRMGFPLCRGGVMAMNPEWCKTLGAWTEAIQGWLLRPQPEALLKANIALDFRFLAGDPSLVSQLESRVGAMFEGASEPQRVQSPIRVARGFLRALAASILERNIQPIPSEGMLALRQWIGGLGGDAHSLHMLQRDLKLHGTSLIVDAVRFLALAHLGPRQWMPHRTVDRIRWLESHQILQAGEASALLDAFEALTALRLERQLAGTAHIDAKHANHVDLLALNTNQRWMLRRHMETLGSLRDKIRLDFGN